MKMHSKNYVQYTSTAKRTSQFGKKAFLPVWVPVCVGLINCHSLGKKLFTSVSAFVCHSSGKKLFHQGECLCVCVCVTVLEIIFFTSVSACVCVSHFKMSFGQRTDINFLFLLLICQKTNPKLLYNSKIKKLQPKQKINLILTRKVFNRI